MLFFTKILSINRYFGLKLQYNRDFGHFNTHFYPAQALVHRYGPLIHAAL